MKKVKFIALALVLTLGLLGAGYAWWSDSVVLGGTVETGTVKVELETSKYMPTEAIIGTYGEPMEIEVTDNGVDTVQFNIGNLYPVSHYKHSAGMHMRMRNYGTVPMKLDNLDLVLTNPDNPAWEHLKIYGHLSVWKYNSESVSPSVQWTKTFQHVYLKDLDTVVEGMLAGEVLDPGYILSFSGEDLDGNTLYIYLDKNAPESIQGESVGYTATFNWVQYNAD